MWRDHEIGFLIKQRERELEFLIKQREREKQIEEIARRSVLRLPAGSFTPRLAALIHKAISRLGHGWFQRNRARPAADASASARDPESSCDFRPAK